MATGAMTLPLLALWPDAAAFWLAYLAALVLEVRLQARRPRMDAWDADRHSLPVIAVAGPLALAAAFGAALLWPQPSNGWFGDRALLWVGILLTGAGALLRYVSIRALGPAFTPRVAVFPGQLLVAQGVYQWLRHPSYTGALLVLVGAGAAMGAWASMVVVLVIAAPAYGYRIYVEEHALLEAFGEPYRRYMRRTYRLVPGLL